VKRFSKFGLLVVLSMLPSLAEARSGASARSGGTEMLSLWGVIDPGPVEGTGLGFRVMLPLAPRGVLHHPRVRDEFTLELGADFVHFDDRVGLNPYYLDYAWNGVLGVAGVTWNFWFTPRFALYPKLDLGYWVGWYDDWDPDYGYRRPSHGGLFLQGAAGLMYRLGSVALRAELGSGLLRLGVGFTY
jgi:hypothetical protein